MANPPINNGGIAANSFELKSGLINKAEAHAFGGTGSEDANKHLTKFIQISNTVKDGVSDDQIRLRLFPFSLKDDARDWYDNMDPNSVATWDEMVELFLEKYYPPSEALKRQAEVISYAMQPQENIQEAWKRFKLSDEEMPQPRFKPGTTSHNFLQRSHSRGSARIEYERRGVTP